MEAQVIAVTKREADAFVVAKHYSRRAPIFWAAFGLVEAGNLEGVCVFGQPSPQSQRCAFRDRDFRLFELARLVVQTATRNAASFLVGSSLSLLRPRPCAVVSFADTEMGHVGIVYQATNWLYTGPVKSHAPTYLVDGKRVHPNTLQARSGRSDLLTWAREQGVEVVPATLKHRYFYLCGDRRERRSMLARLAYPVVPFYPKGDRRRYDDGPRVEAPVDLVGRDRER